MKNVFSRPLVLLRAIVLSDRVSLNYQIEADTDPSSASHVRS